MDFRESVRVIWPGEVSGVVARAVNLSPTGILVDAPTPTPCPVGSDVLCDVALPRGQRLLRGRVAHRRLLSTAKVGMGIEFIDLSPRELAELRHLVDQTDQTEQSDERDEKPQRVKVRFDGTPQIVRARAVPTEQGFRLTTTLPFLKVGTAVDIALAPETGVSAKGWVSSVTLDRTDAGGMPRLLIDVDTRSDRERARPEWDVDFPTPVVETLADENLLEAVPEPVWEPDAYGVPMEPPKRVKTDRIFLEAPLGEPQLSGVETPSLVSTGMATPAIVEFAPGVERGAMPEVEDGDTTQVVSLESTVRPWRAASRGMLVGAIGLAVFVLALLVFRTHPAPAPTAPAPEPVAPVAVATPVAVAPPVAVSAPVVAPAPVAVPAAAPPAEVVEPVAPANSSTAFTVGLAGTLEGVQRYPLRAPDGVAFNLPHAQSSLKVGVYRPGVRGLRAVWVRDLPGGGTHLRFYFGSSKASSRAPARIELDATGAHAFAP